MRRNILLLLTTCVVVLALSAWARVPVKSPLAAEGLPVDDSAYVPVQLHEVGDIALVKIDRQDWLPFEKRDWSRSAKDYSLDAVAGEMPLYEDARAPKRNKSQDGDADRKAGADLTRFFGEGRDAAGFDVKEKDWLTRDVLDLEKKNREMAAGRERAGAANASRKRNADDLDPAAGGTSWKSSGSDSGSRRR